MELLRTIGVLLIIFHCHVYRHAVICETSTESMTTSTVSMTTSTESMTTSTEQMTTSTELQTTSSESVTTEQPTMPTTEQQTTATTAPTPPPIVPNHYELHDGNITCLVMNATFKFTIPYLKTNDEWDNANIVIPENATYAGNCQKSNDIEELEIFFFDKWEFVIDVQKESNEGDLLMADENVNYSWQNVSLKYYIDELHFPEAKDVSDIPVTVSADNLDHVFEASSQGSYKCGPAQNVQLNNVTLAVSDFQYRAFGNTDKDDFPDSGVTECPSGKKDDKDDTGKIVGIVVGSIAGAILIIIIIGCLVQRSRKRGSYEKV